MKMARPILAALLLVVGLGVGGTAESADGVLSRRELVPGGNYGHLRFPAITRESLFTDNPVLKDPSSGDIIDFYGPLDHDPLGKDEVARQRRQSKQHLFGSEG
jgi:hypothetical protein